METSQSNAASHFCLFSQNSRFPNGNQFENVRFSLNGVESNLHENSTNNFNLWNPFHILSFVPTRFSSFSSNEIYEEDCSTNRNPNYFEPLPFVQPEKQGDQPQLSQKHVAIKQMIAQKAKQIHGNRTKSNENVFKQISSHRQQRRFCSFCKSNGESSKVYTSHVLRNVRHEIECPVLMAYVCPKCGATGKSAHTIKYCTALSERERVALPTVKLFKEGRSSSGSQNLFKR